MPMPEGISKGPIFMRLDTLLSSPQRNAPAPEPVTGPPADPSFYYDLHQPLTTPGYDLTSLAIKYGLAVTLTEQNHLGNDWFTNWWPWLQAQGPGGAGGVDEVIRCGLIETIKVAMELRLPVDSYWLCHMQHDHETMHSLEGVKQYHELELDPLTVLQNLYNLSGTLITSPVVEETMGVGVCWSPQQVTMLIHTPPPPPPLPGDPLPALTLLEPIKIVMRDHEGTVKTKKVYTHT